MHVQALDRKSASKEEQDALRVAKPAAAPPAPSITPRSFRNIPTLAPQTKLNVNKPGDQFEAEADKVADEVMTMSDSSLVQRQANGSAQAVGAGGPPPTGGDDNNKPRRPTILSASRFPVQRSGGGEGESDDVSGIVGEGLSGGGQPLDAQTRSFMEPRFGHSFSNVRIHTNSKASDSSEALAARAYAVGSDIAFRSGEYSPGSTDGKRLLAHELTHVVQQTGDSASRSLLQRKLVQRDLPDGGAPPANTVPTDAGAPPSNTGAPPTNTGGSPNGQNAPANGQNAAPNGQNPPPAGQNAPPAGQNGTPAGAPDAGGGQNGAAPKADAGAPGANPGGGAGGKDAGGGGAAPGKDAGSGTAPNGVPATPGGAQATPANQAGGQGSTPAANPDAVDPLTNTHVAPNAYQNTLDGKLTDMLNSRADPANKDRFEKMVGAADSARLASLQFTFNPTGIGELLFQSVIPVDSLQDHLRGMTTDNPYAASASFGSFSGWVAGLQTGIEFLRGVIRMAGDIVAGAGSGLGFLALGAAGLALIPPLAGAAGPIAAAAATAAEILALVKVGADAMDSGLGFLQILLSVIRARTSDDPADRARICQQIKKEANDISTNLTQIIIQGASFGVGKAIGKIGGRLAGAEVSAESGNIAKLTVKDYMQQFSIAGREALAAENDQQALKALMAVTDDMNKGGALTMKGAAMAARSSSPRLILASIVDKSSINNMFAAQLMNKKMAGAIGTGLALGVGFSLSQGEVKAVGANQGSGGPNTGTNAPNKNQAVPNAAPEGVTFEKAEYWPSILEQFGSTREWIHNAQVRMRDQYTSASHDAGDKAKGVAAVYGSVSTMGNRISVAGGAQATKADAGQASAKDVSQKAKDAKDAQQKSTDAQKNIGAKADEGKSKADAAKNAADGAGKDQSTWDKVKSAVWSHTLGWVFSELGSMQHWVNDVIVKIALNAAGMKDSDLDLAGIDRKAMHDESDDKTAAADAKDTQAVGANVDKQAEELKKGATDGQQNAIQGMIDSMAWIEELDNWDQALANQQDSGESYLTQAAAALSHQSDTQEQKAGMDAAYLQPLIGGATRVRDSANMSVESLKMIGTDEIQDVANQLTSGYPGSDPEPIMFYGKDGVDKVLAGAKPELEKIGPAADGILKSANALMGSTDYGQATQLSTQIDDLSKNLERLEALALKQFDQLASAIVAAYNEVIQENNKAGGNGGAPAVTPTTPPTTPTTPPTTPTTPPTTPTTPPNNPNNPPTPGK